MFSVLGCSTLQGFFFPQVADKDASVAWEKDLKMKVNGKLYYGTAVVPKADVYTISIYPAYKEIDRLQWRTCHRGGHADQAVEHGFWPWSKRQKYFTFKIRPKDIERERACALKIEALAKRHKSMAFGMIAFPDIRPWYNISSTVECNGKLGIYTQGTSLCQAPFKSIQRISFSGEVYMDDKANSFCPPFKEIEQGVFEFFMPKNECIYNFVKAEEHSSGRLRSHKFITFGYEKTPPPED